MVNNYYTPLSEPSCCCWTNDQKSQPTLTGSSHASVVGCTMCKQSGNENIHSPYTARASWLHIRTITILGQLCTLPTGSPVRLPPKILIWPKIGKKIQFGTWTPYSMGGERRWSGIKVWQGQRSPCSWNQQTFHSALSFIWEGHHQR